MALAAVSAATFRGDFFFALGSVLVLCSLSKKLMTARWAERMTTLGAMSLLFGAIITTGPGFFAYWDGHHVEAGLAISVFVIVFALVLTRALHSVFVKDVSSKKGKADEGDGTYIDRHEPDRDSDDDFGGKVEKAEGQ